jgi:hypothetical protein
VSTSSGNALSLRFRFIPQRRLVLTILGVVWVSLATACQSNSSTTQPGSTPEPVATAEPTPPSDTAPPTLLTYDGPATNYPITAQYPDTMQVDGGCAGEGCGFFFAFVPQGNALDDADLHIFLPAGVTTAADQQPFVTGPNGLIENAGWIVSSVESNESEDFTYPWVETVISFNTDQEEGGYILLGQSDGQAVQVIVKYPTEMADTYWNSTRTVLDTLEFEADLLPLKVSTEGSAETGEDPDTMCDPAKEPC